jgi:hypothetical protein
MSLDTTHRGSPTRSKAPWLPWTAAALGATVVHLLIDYHIGLYGQTSDTMSALQATSAARQGVLIAWWLVVAVAAVYDSGALTALFWLVVVDASIMNGVVAFAVAPPPSDAFPYQDLTHGAALVFGVVAAVRISRHRTQVEPPIGRGWLVATIGVLVVVQLLGFALFVTQGVLGQA